MDLALLVAGLLAASGGLSFAWGSRLSVSNILSTHAVRALYQPGDIVAGAGKEGRILRITATSVVIETREGDAAIPSDLFLQEPSTRLSQRSAVRRGSSRPPGPTPTGRIGV